MIKFDTVTKKYGEDIVALQDVDFEIDEGEFCFVTGPSGAGKSTIVKLLIKDEVPTSGSIFYEDIEVPKIPRNMLPSYRQKLGVVFQDMKLLNTRTLQENIAFALEILQKEPKEIKDTTDYLLELVGLENRRNLFPQQLSGGEQQRGAIARALASNPGLLVADEPTGNLDDENAYMILDILRKINKSGTTVMVITHDNILVEAEKESARRIHLKEGKIESDTKGKKSSKKKEYDIDNSIDKAMGKKINKEEKEMDPELEKLSKGLVEKFKQNAIYSIDLILNLTESDLKQLKLNKKEEKELKKYIKNYLSLKKDVTKKKN
jgi:cell division transport system ATP-binding protein